jgi:hypothetical protein
MDPTDPDSDPDPQHLFGSDSFLVQIHFIFLHYVEKSAENTCAGEIKL